MESLILYEGSQISLIKYIPNVPFNFEYVTAKEAELFHQDCMSMIMLWSPGSFIKLSTLYKNKDITGIYSLSNGESATDINEEMNGYKMKEFSNLQGGFFRSLFDHVNIFVGMSLPFLTTGKSESTFNKLLPTTTKKIYWKASVNDYTIYFSAEYELRFENLTAKTLEKFKSTIDSEKVKKVEDSGDIEFL